MPKIKGRLELLRGKGLQKALRVLDQTHSKFDWYSIKIGRKTVFIEDHMVCTVYCRGDDGRIYIDKIYEGLDAIDWNLYKLLALYDAAMNLEPILSDYVYIPRPK